MGLAPDDSDLADFTESVDEVSRLIQGLKAGTISPEYIQGKQERGELHHQKKDQKIEAETAKQQTKQHQKDVRNGASTGHAGLEDQSDTDGADAAAAEQRKAELQRKMEELKANRFRKLKARERYNTYVHGGVSVAGGIAVETDYTKWDLWCPEDEEDDMFNSIPPNTPQFRAMEKDIEERHQRMIEQRQLGERQRVAGNAAFKAGQYSEALRCYQAGIDAQKTNMTLHANAAMAALKLHCNVQAIEHCDKVLHIADFLHSNTRDPLCIKALQRRAAAYRALQQPTKAVRDLTAALDISPADPELQQQLAAAQLHADEAAKQRVIQKALAKEAVNATADGPSAESAPASVCSTQAAASGVAASSTSPSALDLTKLRRVEVLCQALQPCVSTTVGAAAPMATPTVTRSSKAEVATAASLHVQGPQLPDRRSVTPRKHRNVGAAVAEASTATVTAMAAEDAAMSACKELQLLLQDDDLCCVYFRECGGLQAVAAQVAHLTASSLMANSSIPPDVHSSSSSVMPSSDDRVATSAFLALLNTACMNDVNLQRLPSLTGLVPNVVAWLGIGMPTAATLLCTAVTVCNVRRAVSKALAAPNCLAKVIAVLSCTSTAVQAIMLTLLGNCLVDKACKDAMLQLLSQQGPPALNTTNHAGSSNKESSSSSSTSCNASCTTSAGTTLLQLMQSNSPVVAERAINLLGNMCGEAGLRQQLVQLPGAVAAMLQLVLYGTSAGSPASTVTVVAPTTIGPKHTSGASHGGEGSNSSSKGSHIQAGPVQVAACALLYNLCLDATAQAAVAAAGGETLAGLLQLMASHDSLLAARAAGIVSRLAKNADGLAALRRLSGVQAILTLLASTVQAPVGTAPQPNNSAVAAASEGAVMSVATASSPEAVAQSREACVRTLALMTASSDASVQDMADLGGVQLLLQVLGVPGAGDACLGNAALSLGHAAKVPALLPLMRDANAVPPLLKVAYEGRGNVASKNAAIALARMAHEPALLLQLKELHGLEIIYQYVKP